MKPFLLLSTRADDDVARHEWAEICRLGELEPERLVQWRLEQEPMPTFRREDWAGVVIGGSPYDVSNPEPDAVQRRAQDEMRAVVREAVEAEYPLLGLCFGIGIVGTALDGLVDSTFGEPPSVVLLKATAQAVEDPLLQGLGDGTNVIVGHKEACTAPPTGAVVLLTGERCPVQMYRVGRSVYATQFHPELDVAGLAYRLNVYAHHGYCRADEVDSIVDSMAGADVSTSHLILRNFFRHFGSH